MTSFFAEKNKFLDDENNKSMCIVKIIFLTRTRMSLMGMRYDGETLSHDSKGEVAEKPRRGRSLVGFAHFPSENSRTTREAKEQPSERIKKEGRKEDPKETLSFYFRVELLPVWGCLVNLHPSDLIYINFQECMATTTWLMDEGNLFFISFQFISLRFRVYG
jgi:hypothetical protein